MSFRKCKFGGYGQIYFQAGGNNGLQLIMPQYRQLCTDSGKITEALNDTVSTDPVVFNLPFNLTATGDSPSACAPKLLFLERKIQNAKCCLDIIAVSKMNRSKHEN